MHLSRFPWTIIFSLGFRVDKSSPRDCARLDVRKDAEDRRTLRLRFCREDGLRSPDEEATERALAIPHRKYIALVLSVCSSNV